MAKKKTAKKSGTSKSQAIRDQLAKAPNASANDIAAAASKQIGEEVKPALVYNIKSTEGGAKKKTNKKTVVKKKAVKKSSRKAAPKQTSPTEDVKHAGQLMLHAVDLVMKAGAKEAKSMVELASKMVERIKDKE